MGSAHVTNKILFDLICLLFCLLFWEIKDFSCEKLLRNYRSGTTLCTTPFTEQRKLSLTRIEREVGDLGA
jgi:hypothetical protein